MTCYDTTSSSRNARTITISSPSLLLFILLYLPSFTHLVDWNGRQSLFNFNCTSSRQMGGRYDAERVQKLSGG